MTTDLFERYAALDPVEAADTAPDWDVILSAVDERVRLTRPDTRDIVPQPGRTRWRGVLVAAAVAVVVIVSGIAVTSFFRTTPIDATQSTIPSEQSIELANAAPAGSSAPVNVTFDVAVDGDTLWAVTWAGIVRWDLNDRTGELFPFAAEVPGAETAFASEVAIAPDGTVWTATTKGPDTPDSPLLVRFDGTGWTQPDGFAGLHYGQLTALATGPDGTLYAPIGPSDLTTFDGADWETVVVPPDVAGDAAERAPWAVDIVIAQDGTLWAAGFDDVVSFDGTNWRRFTTADGIPAGTVPRLAVAPNGHVWVVATDDGATQGGIGRYDGTSWTTFTTADGLFDAPPTAVTVGPDGVVWVTHHSSAGSAEARASGGISRFDGTTWSTTEISNVGAGFGTDATVDASGTLWVATNQGIVEFDGVSATALRIEADTTPNGDTPVVTRDDAPVATHEVPHTVVTGGTDILATTVAGPAPAVATCPAGSQPDRPGPLDQARPAIQDGQSRGTWSAAIDARSGHLFVIDGTGATWTMDVCTNTWRLVGRPGETTVDLRNARTLVYDADSDKVVAFAHGTTAAFDAESGTWEELTTVATHDVGHAVYDPVSGLIVTRNEETSVMQAYDVDADSWTQIDQGTIAPPSIGQGTQIMVYDRSADQIVLHVGDNMSGPARWDGIGHDTTWVFDPRRSAWSLADTITPEVGWLLSQGAYDEAAGLTVIPDDGAMVAYDAPDQEWRVLWENPETTPTGLGFGPHSRWAPWVAYDPINGRLLVGGGWHRTADGSSGVDWVDDPDDVWAFDTRTATWLELVPSTRR